MNTERLEQFFRERAFDPDTIECENCEFLEVTPDMYATGDSPTGYDCSNVRWDRCPKVIQMRTEL